MEQKFQFLNQLTEDNFFIFETLKIWFEKHTQITQFFFLTYRQIQNFQFETTDFITFFCIK
jgi:hypothetical protein